MLELESTRVDKSLMKRVEKVQRETETAREGLLFLAHRSKNPDNATVMLMMAEVLEEHLRYLEQVTGHPAAKSVVAIWWFKIKAIVLGMMFSIRSLQRKKRLSSAVYSELSAYYGQAETLYEDALVHEQTLTGLLDEERLHYVGAVVLGLNDALVELTGAIAGVTFSLCNTKLVALTGIVTGIAATLSMAGSNYLAVKEDGTADATKSAVITGVSYLATVVVLVLPYLVLPDDMYLPAFAIMLATVIVILVIFNYYLSVANDTSFWKRFIPMAAISLGVAAISYGIGIAAKYLLGLEV